MNTPPPAISFTRFAIALAALSMIGPFSIDSALPAFPAIATGLAASNLAVQQTLTAYLASFAAMILWHGAISDAYGRRRPILWSLVVFGLASIGCAAAPSITWLVAARVVQGLSAGAGVVVGRAMIRDTFAGPEAERLMALVTMIFAIGPALAPVLGGFIVTAFGWRTIFLFLVLYSVLLFALSFTSLPETLPPSRRRPLAFGFLARSYWKVFSSARFHGYAGMVAFNFGGLFLYVAAAPVYLLQHLKLSPQGFFWLFGPLVTGIFLGALIVNRVAGRVRLNRQVTVGFVLMASAAAFMLGYHLLFAPQVPYSVLPLFFYSLGMALVAPGVTLMTLDLFPDFRGIAASCQSATQTMLGAVIAGLIAPWLAPSVIALALGQCAFVVLGFVAWRASGGVRNPHRVLARINEDSAETGVLKSS